VVAVVAGVAPHSLKSSRHGCLPLQSAHWAV